MSRIYGDIRPLKDKILVRSIEKGQQITKGGIIIPDDDAKDRGIRPRWAQVYKFGKKVDFLTEGEWVLVEHGRWSPAVTLNTGKKEFDIRLVDKDCILGTSDTKPENINV